MSVQPSSAEELPETAVGKDLLDGVANESAIVLLFFLFAGVTVYPDIKFLLLFYNARAIYWACAGKEIWCLACVVHYIYIYIYIATDVRIYLKLCLWI